MGIVYASLSMSLDGFIAGRNVSVENGMGDGGEQLHGWMFAPRTPDEATAWLQEQLEGTGAVLMGRTMLDVGIGPWGDNPVFHAPVFVLTNRASDPIVKQGGTSYTFVTDGPREALRRASEAAGDQDICVAGGAQAVREYLRDGVIEELRLHVVPILLGGGTRLFEDDLDSPTVLTVARGDIDADGVAHLVYQIGQG